MNETPDPEQVHLLLGELETAAADTSGPWRCSTCSAAGSAGIGGPT
jgi:hypothetical protein